MKKAFHTWWKESYESLLDAFKEDTGTKDLIKTLLPLIERNAIQYFPHRKRTLKDTIRTYFIVLFYSYKIDFPGLFKKAEVFFWPAQIAHLEILIPVYLKLAELRHQCVFVTDNPKIAQILEKEQIEFLHIKIKKYYSFKIKNFRRFRALLNIQKVSKQFVYGENNVKFSDIVFKSMLHFPTCEEYSEIYRLICKSCPPKYNLLGFDFSLIGRTIGSISNETSTPSGVIQHGILNYHLLPYSEAKQHFLWDQQSYDSFVSKNLPRSQSFITGYPYPKRYNKYELSSAIKELRENILKDYTSICLVAFSGPGQNISVNGHRKNLEIVSKLMKNMEGTYFIIKLHPKDYSEFYGDVLKNSNTLLIDKKHQFYAYRINELLQISDLILTGASAVTLESFHYAKPVVSLDSIGEIGQIELLRNEMLYFSGNLEELTNNFNSVLNKDTAYLHKMSLITGYKNQHEQLIENDPAYAVCKKIIETIKN